MKITVSKLFRIITILSTIFMLGFLYIIPGFDIDAHLGGYKFIVVLLGICMFLFTLTCKDRNLHRCFKFLNKYLPIFLVVVLFEAVYSKQIYGYTLNQTVFEVENYLYIFFAYPLIYIYYKDKEADKFIRVILYLVLGILTLKTISWVLYNFAGITVFKNLLFEYGDWIRDGYQRVTCGYLFGFAFGIFCYRAFTNRNKPNSNFVLSFLLIAYVIVVMRTRIQAIVMIVIFGMTYYYAGFSSKKKSVRFLLILVAAILMLVMGVFDKLIDSFSIVSGRSGSTLARVLGIQHYWNYMYSHKSFFGLGFLNDTASNIARMVMFRSNWQVFVLEDLGILSGIIRFGIFALPIYIPLYYKTIKLIILAHKKREKKTELLLISVGGYMILSCFVLNIFDAQRSFDVPFYLSIICYCDWILSSREMNRIINAQNKKDVFS